VYVKPRSYFRELEITRAAALRTFWNLSIMKQIVPPQHESEVSFGSFGPSINLDWHHEMTNNYDDWQLEVWQHKDDDDKQNHNRGIDHGGVETAPIKKYWGESIFPPA